MARERGLAKHIPTRLTPAEGRRFGFTVGGAFLLIGAVLWWRAHPDRAMVAATIGALLILAAIAVPGHLGPVYRVWMKLGLALSKVTNPIMLGVLYFFVFTPAGWFMRLFGRNPLTRSRVTETVWITRGGQSTRRSNLQRQF